MAGLRLALVAAEASGDLLAADLLRALALRWPELDAFGIGGPHMAAAGFHAWWPIEKLSVRGYAEVLPRLPGLLRLRAQLIARLERERPDLVIGVDAPDFNFTVERRLRARGLKTLHFVSPSFWAWRPERLQALRQAADHVLCVFPFEPELLARAGIASTYVGYPLAATIPMEVDRAAARAPLDLPAQAPVVALLPGSRAAEVRDIAPRFFAAALLLHAARPELHFVLPAVPWLRAQIDAIVLSSGAAAALGAQLRVVDGAAHTVLAACDVALVASGTATLEAALYKRPMVIAYAMPQFSYRLMRRKRLLPWVGLPNILCAPPELLRDPPAGTAVDPATFLVPELIQDAATPATLAAAALAWLEQPERVAALQQRFTRLHVELRRASAELATEAIAHVLET